MVRIFRGVGAVAGHVGVVHGVSSEQIVKPRCRTVKILFLIGDEIGVGKHYRIVRHKGI